MAALLPLLLSISCTTLTAQPAPQPVIAPGNAAVTGFSGARAPIQIAPGIDPDQKTFIDLGGATLRVVDLQHMGGPPAAQTVGAPKPITVTAASIGQVFGVTLDDAKSPNIYAAATSAYGLPIVARGADGQLDHIRSGTAKAAFMDGLWGPLGGPGSIWKIDGVTGAVSLFATVMHGGETNSGPALGGLAYDPGSKSLYVADRETGLVHRFGPDGADRGVFDHGVQGRTAQGLRPVPDTAGRRLDITATTFDSTQPATWNYAAPERRLFGLAVYRQRLYYAVADGLQIWSVGLAADGAFGDDPVIELVVPSGSGPTEISRITFDEQGRMFLAERAAPTGAFDFEALAVPAIGRVLRLAVIGTTANGRRIWQEQPAEDAIGFPRDFRNGDGGVAIGDRYDAKGDRDPTACGGFMWSTGEVLRHPEDAALAARLARSGPLDVSGLQGNGTWLARPANAPPRESYFIAYVDGAPDPAARGQMGDIAILRTCSGQRGDVFSPLGGAPPSTPAAPPHPRPGRSPPPATPPGPPATPPNGCPPDQIRRVGDNSCGATCPRPGIQIGGKCCTPGTLAAGGACSNSGCSPGQTAIGPSNFCCASGQVYAGPNGAPACCTGAIVNGQCQTTTIPPTGPCQMGSTTPPCCSAGYVPTGTSCCLAGQATSTGTCCAAGQMKGGPNDSQCVPILHIPSGPQCCGPGLIPAGSGGCCAAANLTTAGVCCARPVDPHNRGNCPMTIQAVPHCAAGYSTMPDGSCCKARYVGADGKSCNIGELPCAPGQVRAAGGVCAPAPPPESCAPGTVRDRNGRCEIVAPPPPLPEPRTRSRTPPRHREPRVYAPGPPGPPPPGYGFGRFHPGGRFFLLPRGGPLRGRGFGFGFRR